MEKVKKCWVDGCEESQIEDSLYCKKHDESEKVEKLKIPGVIGSGQNIPK